MDGSVGGVIPLYSCPPLEDTFNVIGIDAMSNTPTCRVDIAYNYESAWNLQKAGLTVPYGTKPQYALERCILPHEDKDYIHCYTASPCSYSCRTSDTNEVCPDPSTINKDETVMMQNEQCDIWLAGGVWSDRLDCYKLQLNQYCGYTYDYTPGDIIAIRGLIFADAFIVLFWLCAEFVLRKVDKGLKREQAEGSARMEIELPSKRHLLRQQVMARWSTQAERNYYSLFSLGGVTSTTITSSSSDDDDSLYSQQQQQQGELMMNMVDGGSISTNSRGGSGMMMNKKKKKNKSRYYSRDPGKRFQSSTWLKNVSRYKELSSTKKHRFNSRAWTRNNKYYLYCCCCSSSNSWLLFPSPT